MSPLSALPPEILNCVLLHGNALCASTTGRFSCFFSRPCVELPPSRPFALCHLPSFHICSCKHDICALPESVAWTPWQLDSNATPTCSIFLRKEVIQPHLPIRLPCYDFTPVIRPAFGSSLLTVGSLTSGISDSHGVTGGVYKTRERIHRDILIRDY